MGQSRPFKTRDRSPKTFLTAEECAQRAADLFADAQTMAPGTARQSVLKEACQYRMLGEMKRLISNPAAGS
jgi:hypothetical protein